MGTNYFLSGRGRKRVHIGKRSAAGVYCWDCGVTLCVGGINGVHHGYAWLEACPRCGRKKSSSEELPESAAGRELGFNKSPPHAKTGVASCSSFTWAICPDELKDIAVSRPSAKIVVDEYGRRYTIKEFYSFLLECPIQSTDLVGQLFS
jgi:hypothetical protein